MHAEYDQSFTMLLLKHVDRLQALVRPAC